jgi:lantibiotic modifying enzyme
MQWHGPNDDGLWLGQSHGVAGVVQQLLEVPELLENATALGFLRRTLDWVVSQQFASGNFPTEYYNATDDVLVQWYHGAPGVAAALLAGWRAFGQASYRASAERALECVWERGLLLKGLMNCHGIGGNIWMQLYAAKLTGDLKYRYRALAFLGTVLSTPLLSNLTQMRQPQPLPNAPWGFWTGSIESSIELWTDLLYRGPANASMTGWEARL